MGALGKCQRGGQAREGRCVPIFLPRLVVKDSCPSVLQPTEPVTLHRTQKTPFQEAAGEQRWGERPEQKAPDCGNGNYGSPKTTRNETTERKARRQRLCLALNSAKGGSPLILFPEDTWEVLIELVSELMTGR